MAKCHKCTQLHINAKNATNMLCCLEILVAIAAIVRIDVQLWHFAIPDKQHPDKFCNCLGMQRAQKSVFCVPTGQFQSKPNVVDLCAFLEKLWCAKVHSAHD